MAAPYAEVGRRTKEPVCCEGVKRPQLCGMEAAVSLCLLSARQRAVAVPARVF